MQFLCKARNQRIKFRRQSHWIKASARADAPTEIRKMYSKAAKSFRFFYRLYLNILSFTQRYIFWCDVKYSDLYFSFHEIPRWTRKKGNAMGNRLEKNWNVWPGQKNVNLDFFKFFFHKKNDVFVNVNAGWVSE